MTHEDKLYEVQFALLAIAPRCEGCGETATRTYLLAGGFDHHPVCDNPDCMGIEHHCTKCRGKGSGNESGPLSRMNRCMICNNTTSLPVSVAKEVRDLPYARVLRESIKALLTHKGPPKYIIHFGDAHYYREESIDVSLDGATRYDTREEALQATEYLDFTEIVEVK
jgi:hypothetical protein